MAHLWGLVSPAERFTGTGGWPLGQMPGSSMEINSAKTQREVAPVDNAIRRHLVQAGKMPFKVYKLDGVTSPVPVEHKRVTPLLRRPNPSLNMTHMTSIAMQGLFLSGEAFMMYNVAGSDAELWPLPVDRVNPIPVSATDPSSMSEDSTGWVDWFEVTSQAGGAPQRFPASQIVHAIDFHDTDNPVRGQSRLVAMEEVLNLRKQMIAHQSATLRRGGAPSGIFTHTSRQPDRAYVAAKQRQVGGPENAGGVLTLGPGETFTKLGQTAAELEYHQSLDLTERTIYAGFAILPAVITSDATTYDNMATAISFMITDGTLPLLIEIASAISDRVFTPEERIEGWSIAPDLAIVRQLTKDPFRALEVWAKASGSGIPLDTLANQLGIDIPEFPGSDRAYMSLNVHPLERQDPMEEGDI